jgi:SPP1 family predicted phage head-tail adaptor
MQINPGNLNKKVTIIRYILTKDADGSEVKLEEPVLDTWAQVSNRSGKSLSSENSDFSSTQTRFLIRTPKITIDKDYLIKFRNEIYDIVYVNDYNFDGIYTEILGDLVMK